jgi:large subunit ribosomal protein L16
MNGVNVDLAREAMRLAIYKMPMRCKFYTKADLEAEQAALEAGYQEKAAAKREAAAQ